MYELEQLHLPLHYIQLKQLKIGFMLKQVEQTQLLVLELQPQLAVGQILYTEMLLLIF